MGENSKLQIFDDYINTVCRKIMSKRKKNEVRDELYSHLLEEYERNSVLGMEDEAAQTAAIEKMGDSTKLANSFARLYSVSPPAYMRTSMNFLLLGIILTYINYEVFPGLTKLCVFTGQMLILYGLFKIRKMNRKVNTALLLFPVLMITENTLAFLQMYFSFDKTVTDVFTVISTVCTAIFYWYLFSGFNKSCYRVLHENENTPHLYLGYSAFILFLINIAFLKWSGTLSTSVFFYIPFFLALLTLNNAKRILTHNEPEIELNHILTKKEKVIYWSVFALFLIIPFTSMYLAASREPETEKYNQADTSIVQEEITFARKHMLELGFPKEYLDDLPDSEVLKYTTATYMQVGYPYEYKRTPETVEVYYFYFEGSGIRALNRISLPDNASNYRYGFYLEYRREDFVYPNSSDIWSEEDYTNFNGSFFLALSEKNGETVSSEYFEKTSLHDGNSYNWHRGYEYSFPDESTQRRAYIAESAFIQSYGIRHLISIDAKHYRKDLPVYLTYNHFSELAEEDFIKSREWPVDDFSIDDVPYGDTLDFDPTKVFNG